MPPPVCCRGESRGDDMGRQRMADESEFGALMDEAAYEEFVAGL